MRLCSLLVAFVFTLVLVGGGKNVEGNVIVALAAGLVLVFSPPRFGRVSWPWIIVFVVPLVQMLPMVWPGNSWTAANAEAGLPIPWSQTPVVFKAVESYLLFFGIGVLFLRLREVSFDEGARVKLSLTLAIVMGLAGLVVFWAGRQGWSYPYQAMSHVFSFFPNRNQQGLLFALAAVLSFGMCLKYLIDRRYILFVLCAGMFAMSALGCVSSISKACVLLLGVGMLAVFMLSRKSLPLRQSWGVLGVFAVSGIGVLTLFGDRVLGRFSGAFGNLAENSFRIKIWKDTMPIVADTFPFGLGLGQFEYAFAQYREHSVNDQWISNPENDYLWFVSELGIVGALVSVLIVAWFVKAGRAQLKESEFGVRAIYWVLAGMILAHGLIDFNLHIPAMLMLFLCIVRVLDDDTPSAESGEKRGVLGLPRWLGGGMIAVATLWTVGVLSARNFHSSDFRNDAMNGSESESIDDRLLDYERALEVLPLDWELHVNYGFALIRLNQFEEGLRHFEFAKYLEPVTYKPALFEGKALLAVSERDAFRSWTEALYRYPDHSNYMRVYNMFEQTLGKRRKEFASELGELKQIAEKLNLQRDAVQVSKKMK